MLVLTRKNRESVVVGDPGTSERLLTITVLEIKGSSVRLSFDADAAVPVHRLEVWERIRADHPPQAPEAPEAPEATAAPPV